jgi:hypothetical protein
MTFLWVLALAGSISATVHQFGPGEPPPSRPQSLPISVSFVSIVYRCWPFGEKNGCGPLKFPIGTKCVTTWPWLFPENQACR